MAATETVVHDPRKRSMDAIQQRLQKDQLRQQQQQQQKNEKDKKRASDVSSKEPHKPALQNTTVSESVQSLYGSNKIIGLTFGDVEVNSKRQIS